MAEGIIVSGYASFYYVDTGEGIWECRLRGRHRLAKEDFLPGDRVQVSATAPGQGVIEAVLPRQTRLTRPAVANVDLVVVVMAFDSPPPDRRLLDRLLILAAAAGVDGAICWNKADLANPATRPLPGLYAALGYPSLITSARLGQGVDELDSLLAGRVACFAGPSGVGKSSLLNAIKPGLKLETGEVGAKLARGRHTTRHARLVRLPGGGLVADTPGFSLLDLPAMKREELAGFFPEMEPFLGECRFNSCLHRVEPECRVRAAVEAGGIDATRYQHYLDFLAEVIQREREY